jgi:tRNA(His) 5'-end guanylyltransferase
MAHLTLKERIESYQNIYDHKIIPRIPLILTINGKSFSKVTSLVNKPFCSQLSNLFKDITISLCEEIEGVFFAYQFNDEIVLILRNDQSQETIPLFDNRIQKIISYASSLATFKFNQVFSSLPLKGEPIFISNIFAVPNIVEVVNTLIYKQQYNSYASLQFACYYELLRKYDKDIIKNMIRELTIEQKVSLLDSEFNINFNDYPIVFRRGISFYKGPVIENNIIKTRWVTDSNLPIFAKNQSYLLNIFKNSGVSVI